MLILTFTISQNKDRDIEVEGLANAMDASPMEAALGTDLCSLVANFLEAHRKGPILEVQGAYLN